MVPQQMFSRELNLIKRENVIAAIDAVDLEPIVPGEKFSVVYKGQRFDPKDLLAHAYLFATGTNADVSTWHELTYQHFTEKLEDLEFRVVKNPKQAGDTSLPVMVYEVKSPDVVQANYQKLFSSDRKRFYWNNDKFAKLKAGDPVFVVNAKAQEVLYCLVDVLRIETHYNHEKDLTSFSHIGEQYEVAGQWNEFICLKIRDALTVSSGWHWKTLGSGEHTYLCGPSVSENSALNNLERTNLLLEASSPNSETEIQLQVCFQSLSSIQHNRSSLEKKNTEPTLWYVMQGDTFNPDKGQKYLWAPLKDKRGTPQKHHLAVKDIKTGDYIVHHAGGMAGISIAKSKPVETANPFDESRWNVMGTRVDVQLLCQFDPKISVDEIRSLRAPLANALAEKRGPYNSSGTGNQGYLFEFTWEALAILLQKSSPTLPDEVNRWLPIVDVWGGMFMALDPSTLCRPPDIGSDFAVEKLSSISQAGVVPGTIAERRV